MPAKSSPNSGYNTENEKETSPRWRVHCPVELKATLRSRYRVKLVKKRRLFRRVQMRALLWAPINTIQIRLKSYVRSCSLFRCHTLVRLMKVSYQFDDCRSSFDTVATCAKCQQRFCREEYVSNSSNLAAGWLYSRD